MFDTIQAPPARFVPAELLDGLRLSKPLPASWNEARGRTDGGLAEVRVVHGDEFEPLGYLVRRNFGGWNEYGSRTYAIYTSDLALAARLTTMSEDALKGSCEMPAPLSR